MVDKQYAGLVFGVSPLRENTKRSNYKNLLHSQNFKMLFTSKLTQVKSKKMFLKTIPKSIWSFRLREENTSSKIKYQLIFW